ncbi:hypothetical protein KCU65_g6217, partial [Aureobasidium melanogenum]
MSQPTQVSILKQCALDHHAQLCAYHGKTPTENQIQEIRVVVGDVAASASKRFLYDLLYFVQTSAIVMKNGYLLVGWVHRPDGTKQEIWFRHIGTRGHVYYHDLVPGLSVYLRPIDARLCDEWHPSLDAISKPWQAKGQPNRMTLYALFNAIIKIMDADPAPPSIEDMEGLIPNNESSRTSQHETHNEPESVPSRPIRSTRRQAKRVLEDEDYDPTLSINTRSATRSLRKNRTKRGRPSVTVDLTGSDSEAGSKPRSSAAPIATNHDKDVSIAPAKQKLLNILESKEVTEIEDMLTKQSGQLPNWIEKLANEEMEKKMARDVAVFENLF